METEETHLDPNAEINLETVKKRSIKGVLALTGRTLILNVISLVAQALLWAYLSPNDFGVFWIVSAVVNFLTYFSDIGLSAALVQKKEPPSEKDLRTTFLVQEVLVFLLLSILLVASPIIQKYYNFDSVTMFLLYALGVSFFLSSLKSIPSILLERGLQFGKFVIPQVLENLVYNLALVYFAYSGFGITSFSYAVLIRSVIGLVTIYILSPWKPGFAFSKKSLGELLHFGVPYQLKSFIAVIKDDGVTILLGGLLGQAGLGYIGMARRWSQLPLRFFMDSVTKVTFPAFSRLQDEPQHLKNALSRSIFFITFLVFPSIVGLIAISPILVRVIPKYNQWIPALLPLAIVSVDSVFAAVTTQLTNALDATGKIKTTFKLMIMWTILTLALVPFLSVNYGVVGAAVGYALTGTSSIVAMIVVKRYINFSFWESFGKTGLCAAVMGLSIIGLRQFLPVSPVSLIILMVVGASIYGISIFWVVGFSIIHDVKKGISGIIS